MLCSKGLASSRNAQQVELMLNNVCMVCSYTCKSTTQLATHSIFKVRDVADALFTPLYSHPCGLNPLQPD